MAAAFYLLLIFSHIGVFDVIYFHWYKCRLSERPECHREVFWHVIRHFVYASQFVFVANFRLHGWALLLLLLLYGLDVVVAWSDVLEETASRSKQGGLPRGEYFTHIVLSLFVGLYFASIAQAVWPDRLLPTAIVIDPPPVNHYLRTYMNIMAVVAYLTFSNDLLSWLRFRREGPPARKIVVEAIISAPVEVVWERTQNPEQHVLWDIRFTGISYLDQKDSRGFNIMDYTTNIGFGISVKGFGHYLQSTPLSHSTFEFDSNDWKSLITQGRGIWLYKPHSQGTYFKTVYDYEVRHGLPGLIVDTLLFRPLMQYATEWGFETLRLWCAGDQAALSSRSPRWKFLFFFLMRSLGIKPVKDAAISWLGTGQNSRILSHSI